jgi:hypothetical protein
MFKFPNSPHYSNKPYSFTKEYSGDKTASSRKPIQVVHLGKVIHKVDLDVFCVSSV